MRRALAAILLGATVACGRPEPAAELPSGHFAVAVFGDVPYDATETARYGRLLEDIARTDVALVMHVGDLFRHPCTDDMLTKRLGELNALPHPVLYTPGDNEWTDCHREKQGGHAPLERLAALRRVMFAAPGRSLGAQPVTVVTQSSDARFSSVVENQRYTLGRFVFATVHVVGSGFGRAPFVGRGAADDSTAAMLEDAAIAWIDAAVTEAHATRAHGVVIAFHAELGLGRTDGPRKGYERLMARLDTIAASYPGQLVLVHGDSHVQRTDNPIKDAAGVPRANVTRIETFGSPEVGWVRVVLDSTSGRVVTAEPRAIHGI